MRNTHFVYIVRCADDSLYTGYATDVPSRIATHNAGKGAKYTRSRRPVALEISWSLPSRSVALRLEAAIKKLPRRQKLALIRQRPSTEQVLIQYLGTSAGPDEER